MVTLARSKTVAANVADESWVLFQDLITTGINKLLAFADWDGWELSSLDTALVGSTSSAEAWIVLAPRAGLRGRLADTGAGTVIASSTGHEMGLVFDIFEVKFTLKCAIEIGEVISTIVVFIASNEVLDFDVNGSSSDFNISLCELKLGSVVFAVWAGQSRDCEEEDWDESRDLHCDSTIELNLKLGIFLRRREDERRDFDKVDG